MALSQAAEIAYQQGDTGLYDFKVPGESRSRLLAAAEFMSYLMLGKPFSGASYAGHNYTYPGDYHGDSPACPSESKIAGYDLPFNHYKFGQSATAYWARSADHTEISVPTEKPPTSPENSKSQPRRRSTSALSPNRGSPQVFLPSSSSLPFGLEPLAPLRKQRHGVHSISYSARYASTAAPIVG